MAKKRTKNAIQAAAPIARVRMHKATVSVGGYCEHDNRREATASAAAAAQDRATSEGVWKTVAAPADSHHRAGSARREAAAAAVEATEAPLALV